MITQILFYVGAILFKWSWEMLDRMGEKKMTAGQWWAEQRLEVLKKALMHVMIAGAWLGGGLPALLGMAGMTTEAIPTDIAANVSPIMASSMAFMFDTIGKPMLKRLMKKAQEE